MKITKNSKQGMDKKEIAEFIQHYEKITKWMMKGNELHNLKDLS